MNEYLRMQKAWYKDYFLKGLAAQDVIGNVQYHDVYPYEVYLMDGMGDVTDRFALDFGCGEGRMIRRMSKFFRRVDGVDISPDMIAAVTGCPDSKLYVIDGQHLDGVPDDEYDFIYSTIAFQHIASWPVRMTLLKEFFRVLRPGGRIALQTVITVKPEDEWQRDTDPPEQHVGWRHSGEGILVTNGYADAMLTPDSLEEAQGDIESVGFADFDFQVSAPPHNYPLVDWIYLYAKKP